MPWNGKGDYYLPFDNETYSAYTTTNVDFDTDILRYGYQSMATPSLVIILKELVLMLFFFDRNSVFGKSDFFSRVSRFDFLSSNARKPKHKQHDQSFF